jgi:hypothetical protein
MKREILLMGEEREKDEKRDIANGGRGREKDEGDRNIQIKKESD